jgi:hypothetical protein
MDRWERVMFYAMAVHCFFESLRNFLDRFFPV